MNRKALAMAWALAALIVVSAGVAAATCKCQQHRLVTGRELPLGRLLVWLPQSLHEYRAAYGREHAEDPRRRSRCRSPVSPYRGVV